MNSELLKYLNAKSFNISSFYLKLFRKEKLSSDEIILLIYFINHYNEELNLDLIKKILGLTEEECLTTFNSLVTKKLLKIETKKNESGKMKELISLELLNMKLQEIVLEEEKLGTKSNIFEVFEKEFGRTLSPMEYEIINAWLNNNISEELIIGALKEATYNGVSNLRYIDKIIYEWGKKGFKNMNDVKTYLTKKDDQKVEYFDYNWLEDEK